MFKAECSKSSKFKKGVVMARGGYRPGSGPQKGTKYGPRAKKVPGAPKRARKPKAQKPPEVPEDIKAEAAAENLDPLSYMLKVMNDKDADAGRRDRMAVAAAPFVHPRKGEGAGKKDEKSDRARAAGSGKFAPALPPKLSVVKK
jgi:phage terminase small subunit